MSAIVPRLGVLGIIIGLSCPCWADESDDAILVIKKAIEAHGGADVLNKWKAAVIKTKGTIHAGDMKMNFVGTNRYQLPNWAKISMEIEGKDITVQFTQLIDGDNVDVKVNGKANKLSDIEKAEIRNVLYLNTLFQLTPLLSPKIYTLSLLKDSPEVAGEPTAVVKVVSGARQDVKLFFSKKSGLLVRMERTGSNADGKEIVQVQNFSDHRSFDGMVRPTRMTSTMDGKPFTDVKLDYKNFVSLPGDEMK